jgi:hypothetical protein
MFGYIGKYIEDKSIIYNNGSGWSKQDMIKVITEAISKVTFSMVQGWYERSFKEIYPGRKIPLYLRSDNDERKFQIEISRSLKIFKQHKTSNRTTRSGRVINKKIY